jgi:transposase InsO family protein
LCGLFGYSRQAYYQQMNYNYKEVVKSEILLQMVTQERKLMPRIGGRKLLYMIQDRLPEELMLGRDSFFNFLRDYGLLVRKKRFRAKTTFSNHWLRKYPNLIKEFIPDGPHQLWVSDITYVETDEGFVYLFLITDAYSRKIIGWSISDTLEANNAVIALYMALSQLPVGVKNVFHHSDRGVQYCCDKYVKLLEKNHFQISMTENGDPLENAIAERVNGILKTEWLYDLKLKTKQEAKEEVYKIINTYNNNRPHCSLDMLTPEQAHNHSGNLKKHWKNYWKQQQITTTEKSLVL